MSCGISDHLLKRDVLKQGLFLIQNLSKFSHSFRSYRVSTTKCSAAVVTATPPAVGAFNAGKICSVMTKSGSKFPPKVAAVF